MTGQRLRNRLYGLFLLACVASLGWPLYPLLGARIEPLVLGMPFSHVLDGRLGVPVVRGAPGLRPDRTALKWTPGSRSWRFPERTCLPA